MTVAIQQGPQPSQHLPTQVNSQQHAMLVLFCMLLGFFAIPLVPKSYPPF